MRILAIDLGSRRIGLAASDELGAMAHPLRVIERRGNRRDAAQVARVAAEIGATELVVGLPLAPERAPERERAQGGRAEGEGEGREAGRARAFAEALRAASGLAVHLVDEAYTTAEAEEALIAAGLSRRKRRAVVDRAAAARILQRFLDARRGRPRAGGART